AVAAGPAAQPVPDVPVSALEVLRALLAVKSKKSFAEIKESDSIKVLSGGKSAWQQEVGGELQKEFGVASDTSHVEMTLAQLAQTIGGGYGQLGKFVSAAVDKLMADKMPGGFGTSQAKAYLSSERLLGEGRMQGVLVLALT